MNWYYTEGGQSFGPMTEAALDGLVQAGTIPADTLVWSDGMADWLPYHTVRQTALPPAEATVAAAGTPAIKPSGLRISGAASHSPAAAKTAPAQADAACSECGAILPKTNLAQIGGNFVCARCKPKSVQKLKEGVSSSYGLYYAGFWIRLGAIFIDGLLMKIVALVIGLAMGYSLGQLTDAKSQPLGLSLLSFGLLVAYEIVCVGTWGATVGKRACGLRVVTANGGKVSYLRATGRYFSKIISALPCAIGYIIAAFDSEKRALHDRICGTRVVKS